MTKRRDITGQQFGSLTAIEYDHTKGEVTYWKFKCKCGNIRIAHIGQINYSVKKALENNDLESPSCGCVRIAKITKHGYRKHSKTSEEGTHPLYKVYRGMMDRCYNSNDPNYFRYGGRGVTVCDAWVGNPKAFIEWSLSNGWEKHLQIDKDIKSKELGINPPIYSPNTCLFVTPKVNSYFSSNRKNYGKNKSIKLSIEKANEIINLFNTGNYSKQELGRMYGVTGMTILYCIRKGKIEGSASI